MGINIKTSLKSMFLEDTLDLENDYKILEVSINSSDSQIEKAYRKLIKKYNPDKLQGVSDDVIKMAKDKFNKVGQAYKRIMKSRG